ncbi:MAG: NAD(P)H-quinone oxidoreductase subunit 3, chloroplastic [Holosporales bacterium]
MMSFYEPYVPVLIFMAFAFGLSAILIIAAYLRSKRHSYQSKDAPYECGFDAFDPPKSNTRRRFEIHFYLVAILFIIFDLEIALLFPWAASFKSLGIFGFVSMMMFLFMLTVGFIYEWRKGALDWE